jgi:hypothetical protein
VTKRRGTRCRGPSRMAGLPPATDPREAGLRCWYHEEDRERERRAGEKGEGRAACRRFMRVGGSLARHGATRGKGWGAQG